MSDFLNLSTLDNRIEGFPYPKRFCPICEWPLALLKVMHVKDQEHIYKAIFACGNPGCESYDTEASMSYARVYYSCDEAVEILELRPIQITRKYSDGEFFKDAY